MLSRKLLHTVPFVENMRSGNGNYVPNQFVIYTKENSYFQSYSTIIVLILLLVEYPFGLNKVK